MPKFIHKPTIVEAHREPMGGQRETPQGLLSWERGDWTINGVNGVIYVITHDAFIESYDPADTEARVYLDKATRR
jgi:hypothetical protein